MEDSILHTRAFYQWSAEI